MSGITSRLNAEQRDAATCIEGPLLVLAGAGTGKTSVITARIAYMIEHGIDPSSILGVTFTNKAAREMRDRLRRIVPAEDAQKVTLGTFHSFCSRVLRREIHHIGNYNSSFSIADTSDQTSLIRQAAADLHISKEEIATPIVAAYISKCKNNLIWAEDALRMAHEKQLSDEIAEAEIYIRYQKLLELQNTLDFDDMLMFTLKIFEDTPEILTRYQDIYKYLLVDEYQDTNVTQFRILQLLAGERMNICVVGDDDQSIYAWRGADISNILDFPRFFPGAKEIKLEQNYRSTNKILMAANAVISRNNQRYDKNLWSSKGDGENLRIFSLETGEAEARFVVNAIEQMRYRNPDMSYSDFAILYRSNHISRIFEQEFRRNGIRPKIIGGQEFFQRKEVKDAAAYLKIIINHRDDQSLLRILGIPPRGIGDKAIETLRHLQRVTGYSLLDLLSEKDYHDKVSSSSAKSAREFTATVTRYRELFRETGNLAGKVREYLSEIGYLNGLQRIYKDIKEAESRQDNVFEFISYIGLYEHNTPSGECSLLEFMENYSLMDDNDRTEDEDERDAPIMTTVHAAKGLEFPCVFVVGMEQNLFPHERALNEGGEEEERRLFYVALTRAREYLFLTFSGTRFKYKEYIPQKPSKFLFDIPEDISEKPDLNSFFPKASDETKLNAYSEIMRMLEED